MSDFCCQETGGNRLTNEFAYGQGCGATPTERPILFSGEMGRAILDGRKTQTRRVVKWPLRSHSNGARRLLYDGEELAALFGQPYEGTHKHDRFDCPYGKVGDRLWVREAFSFHNGSAPSLEHIVYRASSNESHYVWKPSIHMPRWASRITLEITGVRVERLQDISEEDACAEGYDYEPSGEQPEPDAHGWFRWLWDSINAKSHPWSSNPWVWVLEFRHILMDKGITQEGLSPSCPSTQIQSEESSPKGTKGDES